MKSYGKYISKFLRAFIVVLLVLFIFNAGAFFWAFQNVVLNGYGNAAPKNMLQKTASLSSEEGITAEMKEKLQAHQIWAMFLSSDGKCMWQVDLPEEVPTSYTIQEAASFSKGYLKDYPVFVWGDDAGLLVLGYPKDSYIKITGNYYASDMLKVIPMFAAAIGVFDIFIIFICYIYSKRKIIKSTEPIIFSVKSLSDGKPVSLSVKGELSDIAESINKASEILSRQNQARANWISGVSHDIRTPLSMILGYAGRIGNDTHADNNIREQARIIERQSLIIKELVQDLNLVSQLEYEMQPLHKEDVKFSKLLRSYVAELLNAGVPDIYTIELKILPSAENTMLNCDARLISRAINNLVQNSIRHNPQGCHIRLMLDCSSKALVLTVVDDGTGLSEEKRKEMTGKPHYMESVDERLDLRHGLGLALVRQIAEVHNGTMKIQSKPQEGFQTILTFAACRGGESSERQLP